MEEDESTGSGAPGRGDGAPSGRVPVDPAGSAARTVREMRVTITGATGRIGARLTAALRERGDEVTALSRDPERARGALGPHVADWFLRHGWLHRREDRALLAEHLRVADDVVQEQFGGAWAEDPERVVLRQRRGMMRAEPADTATAALVGACDGTLPLGRLVDAVADVLEADRDELRGAVLPVVRRLVADGFLQPE